MTTVDRIIYDELVKGVIREESKNTYREIIGKLMKKGAKGVILGCTEIPLLLHDEDVNLPLFNTTVIHALAALDVSMGIMEIKNG
jgi:aspartate racemase